MSYDPDTNKLGGIVSVFDTKTQTWIATTDANATKLAADINLGAEALTTLQGFVPSVYIAATVK